MSESANETIRDLERWAALNGYRIDVEAGVRWSVTLVATKAGPKLRFEGGPSFTYQQALASAVATASEYEGRRG